MAKELVKAVTGREDKTIGVEIEFFGAHYLKVVDALTAAGIKVEWERYNHRTPRGYWKLTTDGSVTNTGCGTPNHCGLELVSPPLAMDEMGRQLAIVMKTLRSIGAKVDKTCGIHVHHDINDLNVNQIKNIYALYHKHENSLSTFFPESRRDAFYCKSLSREVYDHNGVRQSKYQAAMKATTIEQLKNLVAEPSDLRGDSRYHAINFNSYIAYGTIEFRQHAGSLDADKVMNWVTISQAIVAAGAKKRNVSPLSAHMATRENLAFTRDCYIEGTIEGKYFEKRRAELKRQAV